MPGAPSDEELLRLLREAEQAAEVVELAAEAVPPIEEAEFDPCPFCGEPAQHLGTCTICHETGCLPRDVWSPGMRDPCLTLCVRCARPIHLACASEDEAGNPRCPTCLY